MSKKRKLKKQKPVPIDELIRCGNANLSAGHYKDAIDAFKRLCKQEQREEWRERLADAYSGRARQLAGKGMYQEASVIWENLSALRPQPQSLNFYIACLIRGGKAEKAIHAYNKHIGTVDSATAERIQAVLAPLLIASDDCPNNLAEDSPLIRQSALAKSVLQAYCGGDDAEANRQLKSISYRSPFKDLRVIFSAMLVLPAESLKASEMLAKVSANSAFAGVARVVETATMNGSDWLTSVSELGSSARRCAAALKGIDPKRMAILSKISRARNSAKDTFNQLLANQRHFDTEMVRRVCYQLLPDYMPGIKAYNKRFQPLLPFEELRLRAVANERKDYLGDAIAYWEQAMRWLMKTRPTDENRLRIALIMRHIVELLEKGYGPFPEETADFLESSLESDPDDKPTFLKLLAFYKEMLDDKAYRECVDKALKQFPEDTEILYIAVELALQRNTFKKAARLAKTLLKLDPINTKVRQLLMGAHLSHARKQLSIGKLDLAEKEIDQAGTMLRGGKADSIIPIHRGALAIAAGDTETGEEWLRQGCLHEGDNSVAYFRVAVETGRLDVAPRHRKPYLKQLKQYGWESPSKSDILALMGAIQRYLPDDDISMGDALIALTKYLKKAAPLDFSRQEMEMICDTLTGAEAYNSVHAYAQQALKRWVGEPLFLYFLIYAKTKGIATRMSPSDVAMLERALDVMTENDDTRNANRVKDFLYQVRLPLGFAQVVEQFADELGLDIPEDIGNAIDFPALDDENQRKKETREPKPPKPKKDPFTLDMFDE